LYVADRTTGSVDVLRIDEKSGGLSLAGSTPVGGNPVFLALDGTGKHLLAAYYGDGKAAVYPVLADGTVGAKASSVVETKKNPHSLVIDGENRIVYVPNTGADVIKQYRFDAERGTLTPHDTAEIATAAGDGPRHVRLHPKLPVVYFVNEKSSSVSAYIRADDGSLSLLQNLSTLPDGFTGGNTCAEIHLTSGGEFLYASNRGHDSLAAYRVDPKDGRLTAIGQFATEATPRSFHIAPGDRFIIAAGQSSGRLAVYQIDGKTGQLERLSTHEVGRSPAWVQIVSLYP
jgi:6-phosphogluconolactonase